jgi:hypothetical protein
MILMLKVTTRKITITHNLEAITTHRKGQKMKTTNFKKKIIEALAIGATTKVPQSMSTS